MKLLALDIGEKRIGLATGITGLNAALPAGHLPRQRNLTLDIQAVLTAAAQRKADAIIAGIPIPPDGRPDTPQTRRIRRFIQALRQASPIPIHTIDEAYTSIEAQALLRQANLQPSRQPGSVDQTAAALILHRYLEQNPNPPNLPNPEDANAQRPYK